MSSVNFRFEAAAELPGSDRFARFYHMATRPLLSRLYDVEIEGRENVPLHGPALISPNHLSFSDSVFVPYAMPRRVWAIGKAEYMDSWKTKYLFPAIGMIPVDRSGGTAAASALDTAASVLDRGHLFMIYPEGTRSRDGNLHKGRTGAARLADRCNAPIIPVGVQGTLDVQPPDQFTMNIYKKVTVKIGKPLWISDFGEPDDPRRFRNMIDAVMYEISQLSGQKYIHTYAGQPAEEVEEPTTAADETEKIESTAHKPKPTRPRPTKPPARDREPVSAA